MTPPERAALVAVCKLIVAAMVEDDREVREVALIEAVRRLMELVKGSDNPA